jgi:hypothetical protein
MCRRVRSVLADRLRERSSLPQTSRSCRGLLPRIRKRSNPAVRTRSLAPRAIFSLLSDLLPWDRASPWGRDVYATCARSYVSHGYIVVLPRILIKPGRGGPPEERAGGAASSGSGSQQRQRQQLQRQRPQRQQRQRRRDGSGSTAATGSNGSNGYRGPPPADVCERYRYLRKGICVELAYNRRARSAHTESRGPRLHVSRELYSLREHNI